MSTYKQVAIVTGETVIQEEAEEKQPEELDLPAPNYKIETCCDFIQAD